MENKELEINELLKIRRDKLLALQEEGRDPFQIVKYDKTNNSEEILNSFEKFEGKVISLAGRIMAKREMGKASFCNIQDLEGRIQIYVKTDEVGEEAYNQFKKYDIGDIIGVKGEVFKTHRGEISVKARELILLSKSLQILPEKWHGLKDTDLRYRQRYVDLIVNPDVKKTFITRSKIISFIRNFLEKRGFLEVDTPILNVIAGGASARPFITHHNTLDIALYLRIAPELYLKRLIVGGLEKVFEIAKNFRNEGISIKHNPEFTMIEIYEAYKDYHDMMNLTEELISTAAKDVLGSEKIIYQEKEIDLSTPWKRISMLDSIKEYSGVDFNKVETDEDARMTARQHKISVKDSDTWGEVVNLFFEEKVEKNLIQPTFIYDYPDRKSVV